MIIICMFQSLHTKLGNFENQRFVTPKNQNQPPATTTTKTTTIFCPPITKFMRHIVAYRCCVFFSVSGLFVKFAVVFHRPFWPWQITLDGLSSFSFWIIWARHDGGSQIAHGNGFSYFLRGLNVNTTAATMGTNVLFILGPITHMLRLYNLHCLLVLGSKGRWWFQRTLIFTSQVDSYFLQTGGRYQLFLLKLFLSLRKPPTDAYLKMKVWQRYIIPKKFLASMSNIIHKIQTAFYQLEWISI